MLAVEARNGLGRATSTGAGAGALARWPRCDRWFAAVSQRRQLHSGRTAGGLSTGELSERLAARRILIRSCDSFHGLTPGRFFRLAVRRPADNARLFAALRGLFAMKDVRHQDLRAERTGLSATVRSFPRG